MSYIWVNGQEIDFDLYIQTRRCAISDNEREIKNLSLAADFIQKAIEQHFKTAYKPLSKALAEYGSIDRYIEEMREQYGYGTITKTKLDKITDMARDYENMREIISMLDIDAAISKSISARQTAIRNLQAQIDEMQETAKAGEQC